MADFSRAQLAGSNAHLYLANVLKVCDANNLGGAASVVAEGFRDFTVNAWKQNSLTRAYTFFHIILNIAYLWASMYVYC